MQVEILLVDDQPRNLEALEIVLSSPEYLIHKATSAREALRLVLERSFAVIMLDVMMPDIDGYECARLLRQHPASADTPIIFVTAVATDLDFVFRGYTAGAIDYITKPIEPTVVRAKVAALAGFYRRSELLKTQLVYMRRFCRDLEQQVAELTVEFRTLLKNAERRLEDFDIHAARTKIRVQQPPLS